MMCPQPPKPISRAWGEWATKDWVIIDLTSWWIIYLLWPASSGTIRMCTLPRRGLCQMCLFLKTSLWWFLDLCILWTCRVETSNSRGRQGTEGCVQGDKDSWNKCITALKGWVTPTQRIHLKVLNPIRVLGEGAERGEVHPYVRVCVRGGRGGGSITGPHLETNNHSHLYPKVSH